MSCKNELKLDETAINAIEDSLGEELLVLLAMTKSGKRIVWAGRENDRSDYEGLKGKIELKIEIPNKLLDHTDGDFGKSNNNLIQRKESIATGAEEAVIVIEGSTIYECTYLLSNQQINGSCFIIGYL